MKSTLPVWHHLQMLCNYPKIWTTELNHLNEAYQKWHIIAKKLDD